MEFSDYQEKSRVTAVYPDIGDNFIYPTLGLAGETGEVVEKIKKLIRDETITSASKISDEKKEELKKELGDIVWYLAQLATELDLDLNAIAELNIQKLQERQKRGTLHGSGDNR